MDTTSQILLIQDRLEKEKTSTLDILDRLDTLE